jgi:hypothetical protein
MSIKYVCNVRETELALKPISDRHFSNGGVKRCWKSTNMNVEKCEKSKAGRA